MMNTQFAHYSVILNKCIKLHSTVCGALHNEHPGVMVDLTEDAVTKQVYSFV